MGLVAVFTSSLVALDVGVMSQVLAHAEQFRQAGASITILTAHDSIDGRACDALSAQDGVRAAGALSERDAPLIVSTIPQNPLSFFTSTPGFATMLPGSTGQQHAGALLSVEVADTLGLSIGDSLHTADGVTAVGGLYSYPDDGRPRGMGYALIAPEPAERTFDQCWIDAYPATQATIDMLYTTISAESSLSDSGPTIAQHNQSLGIATTPSAAFKHRMTVIFPGVGFLLGVLIGSIATWARRLELASGLHAGARRRDQASILLLETLAWATTGGLIAVAIIALLSRELNVQNHLVVVLTALKIPAMSVSGVVLGALVASLRVREEHLFAYFKSR